MNIKVTTGILAVLGVVFATSTAQARHCATAYEHIRYGGRRTSINEGETRRLGPWNDHISSLRVAPGCVVNAYEHVGFGGQQATFSGNVPRVGDGWNDRISSMTCTCR